jgi:FKBP-type peptidyl-prolyl cis-trans isomerase FklB
MNTKAALIAVVTLGFALAAVAEDSKAAQKAPVSKEKASYAIGVNIGGNFKRQEVEVDYDQLLKGMRDAVNGTPGISDQELRETLTQFQQELMSKQQEKRKLLGEKNKAEGEKFLAENKGKPGIVTLENGLQYQVLGEGAGEIPKPESMVEVNYRGTLIDGTEFDASKSGAPATFRVNGVIKGWQEALTRMKGGSKWKLFVPADLAYGEFGSGPKIGPHAVLIFEVELLSVKAPPPPPPAPAPLTSDIIKVPSAEEMKKGAKIETLKAEDVERMIKEQQAKEQQAKDAKKP